MRNCLSKMAVLVRVAFKHIENCKLNLCKNCTGIRLLLDLFFIDEFHTRIHCSFWADQKGFYIPRSPASACLRSMAKESEAIGCMFHLYDGRVFDFGSTDGNFYYYR